uniref:Uncharacterized protein n=1 Tax=Aegilops tauschii subsp. strangulata TaxID=200361 RepID=A0A453S5L0_AEGTS
ASPNRIEWPAPAALPTPTIPIAAELGLSPPGLLKNPTTSTPRPPPFSALARPVSPRGLRSSPTRAPPRPPPGDLMTTTSPQTGTRTPPPFPSSWDRRAEPWERHPPPPSPRTAGSAATVRAAAPRPPALWTPPTTGISTGIHPLSGCIIRYCKKSNAFLIWEFARNLVRSRFGNHFCGCFDQERLILDLCV